MHYETDASLDTRSNYLVRIDRTLSHAFDPNHGILNLAATYVASRPLFQCEYRTDLRSLFE